MGLRICWSSSGPTFDAMMIKPRLQRCTICPLLCSTEAYIHCRMHLTVAVVYLYVHCSGSQPPDYPRNHGEREIDWCTSLSPTPSIAWSEESISMVVHTIIAFTQIFLSCSFHLPSLLPPRHAHITSPRHHLLRSAIFMVRRPSPDPLAYQPTSPLLHRPR